MLNEEQEENLRVGALQAVRHLNMAKSNVNNLIKEAQKLGYIISPKTGLIKKR